MRNMIQSEACCKKKNSLFLFTQHLEMRHPLDVTVANVWQYMRSVKKDRKIRSSRKQGVVYLQEIRKNDFSCKCGLDGY